MPTEKFLNPCRLKVYRRAAIFTAAAIIFISALGGKDAGRIGGDYPTFYGAGRILFDTAGKKLYRLDDEVAVQRDLRPEGYPGWGRALPFPYPPFVALAYYPLSLLDYRLSYRLHALLMMLAFSLATWLLSREVPRLGGRHDLALGAALLYYPVLIAVLVAQNIPITFLFYVAAWWAGSRGREGLAGLFLGLMLFKPQFAIPLIGLHLLSGRYRTVMTSAAVASGLYVIGVVTYGPSWLVDWLHYASWVSGLAERVRPDGGVCWLGFLQALLGMHSRVALVAGWTMALVTAVAISLVWYKGRHDPDLSVRFGLAPIALILMQPHAMFYEVGLVLFTYAMCLAREKAPVKLIALLWLLAPLQAAGETLGFSPLFFLVLVSGLMAAHTLLPGGLRLRRNDEAAGMVPGAVL
ncbi:MAG: glycosyltransferase family 87 protein [Syntrophorhabdales bacterium]